MEIIGNILLNFVMGFVNLIILPWHIYQWLTLETLKLKLNAILLAGMSVEFFFMMLAVVFVLIAAGIYRRSFLRKTVYGLEQFNGKMGQFAAWFALLMMLQQVMIIVMGQVFRGNELYFSPMGMQLFGEELQWLSGQLKFYNAMLIAVASAYTFIEGGHVRVDLFYSGMSRRRQHWVDLLGTVFFLFPSAILLWWFSWPIAMNSLFAQRPMNVWSTKASWRGMRFESSGTAEFSWVWSFKFLIVVFAALMFIVAVSFLLRNILGLLEPDEETPAHYSFEKAGKESPAPAQ
ncbi:MAG: TRAP transporter small permease subunit [Pseudomonadota bacterium]